MKLRLAKRFMVKTTSPRCWQLTELAQTKCVEETIWLAAPVKIFSDQGQKSVMDCSHFELALRLQDQGREQQTLGESARTPYEPTGAKIWYRDRRQNFGLKYAQCLLSSQMFFEKCQVRAIYHGQIEAYYDCLLRLPPDRKKDVVPWRKATVYRAMLGGGNSQPPGQTSIMMGPSVDEDGRPQSRTPGVETLSPLPGEDVHPPQPKPRPHTNPSQQGAKSSGLRRPPERRQKPEVVDPPPPAPEVRKPRRVERRPKSIIFGEWDIRYIESPPVNQFRAFCSGHAEDGTDELKCTKSMRVNQGSSEEAVARRLKAWLLEGKACNSRLDHMFYTMVPSEESAGTDAELDARLG